VATQYLASCLPESIMVIADGAGVMIVNGTTVSWHSTSTSRGSSSWPVCGMKP
jgi:hypothetical protein